MLIEIVGSLFIVLLALATLALSMPKKDGGPVSSSPKDASGLYERHERSSMPSEIAEASLVISEKTFYRRGPRPLAAKTDQGFLTREGWLVLVETKTRRRMNASDLVQISAQAHAIASYAENAWRVANWGYIRLAPPGRKPFYQRVNLLQASEIDRLWDRWKALKTRATGPVARPAEFRCRSCVFRDRCPVAYKS